METQTLVIFCTTGIVCLGILAFGIVGSIAFKKTQSGAARSFGLMLRRGNFLRVATVIMVVVAVVYLGVLGIVKENGLIAIMSGVAGYVLGGLDRGRADEDSESQQDA